MRLAAGGGVGERRFPEAVEQALHARVRPVAIVDEPLPVGVVEVPQQAVAILEPVPPCGHRLGQQPGSREAIPVGVLERGEALGVDVEAGLVGDRERAEEAEAEPEGGAHDRVDVLDRRNAVLHDEEGLPQQGVLQAVEHHSRRVGDLGSHPADPREQRLDRVDGLWRGVDTGDDLDAGDEGRRVGEVHGEEALGPADGAHELAHGERRGVAADDRIPGCAGRDPRKYLTLRREVLVDGLLDEVGVGDGVLDLRRGRDVAGDGVCAARLEQSLRFELRSLPTQAVECRLCRSGAHIRNRHVEAGQREDLRYPAPHVAGAHDGYPSDVPHKQSFLFVPRSQAAVGPSHRPPLRAGACTPTFGLRAISSTSRM